MRKQRENAIILSPTLDIEVSFLFPKVTVLLTELYIRMYEIAKEQRDLAKAVAKKDRKAEIKASMIAILFAYTCLEAYINTIGIDHLGEDWEKKTRKYMNEKHGCKYKKNSNLPLKVKWIGVSEQLACENNKEPLSVFSDEKLLSSFKELREIRIYYLVHWKAEKNKRVQTEPDSESIILTKFNSAKARRACKTVKQMVIKLNENIIKPPSEDWLN